MKKLVNLLPFILLVAVTVFSFVKPEISVSISILGLSALAGYKFFLESKEVPNYEKVFAERLEEMNSDYKAKLDALEKEIGKVKFRDLAQTGTGIKKTNKVAGW